MENLGSSPVALIVLRLVDLTLLQMFSVQQVLEILQALEVIHSQGFLIYLIALLLHNFSHRIVELHQQDWHIGLKILQMAIHLI